MKHILVMLVCAVVATAAGVRWDARHGAIAALTRGPATVGAQQATKPKAGGPHTTKSVHIQVSTDDRAEADADSSSSASSDDQEDASDDDSSTPAASSDAARTVTISRQFRPSRDATAPLSVNLSYGVGSLTLQPADPSWLYNVRMSYKPEQMTPSVHFDTATHSLRINSSSITVGPGHHDSGDLQVGLARGAPLDMRVEFGAGDLSMQFGGLALRSLWLSTGASDASIAFDSPNTVDMDRLKLEIGAAGFKATGLGNARVKAISVEAGVGDVDLDFGGHWTNDITLELTSALGAVHVHVPQGVIVDHPASKVFIGSMDDNTGGSTGAGSPQKPGGPLYHLRVSGTTALGAIDFDRHVGAKD